MGDCRGPKIPRQQDSRIKRLRGRLFDILDSQLHYNAYPGASIAGFAGCH